MVTAGAKGAERLRAAFPAGDVHVTDAPRAELVLGTAVVIGCILREKSGLHGSATSRRLDKEFRR